MPASRRLQHRGLAFRSIDDFGTGYSSLSYLKLLPLNQIKIDQSFVKGIDTDNSDAVMVTTIIELARNFGLDVIAEGVETDAHLAFLKNMVARPIKGIYLVSLLAQKNLGAY